MYNHSHWQVTSQPLRNYKLYTHMYIIIYIYTSHFRLKEKTNATSVFFPKSPHEFPQVTGWWHPPPGCSHSRLSATAAPKLSAPAARPMASAGPMPGPSAGRCAAGGPGPPWATRGGRNPWLFEAWNMDLMDHTIGQVDRVWQTLW